jgi:hypothetical protein
MGVTYLWPPLTDREFSPQVTTPRLIMPAGKGLNHLASGKYHNTVMTGPGRIVVSDI